MDCGVWRLRRWLAVAAVVVSGGWSCTGDDGSAVGPGAPDGSSTSYPSITTQSTSPAEQWSRLPEAPIKAGLGPGTLPVWTGREVVVWAEWGKEGPGAAAFDPTAGTWRMLPAMPVARRSGGAAVWTGQEVLMWGGTDGSQDFADGAAYDLQADRWRLLPPSPVAGRYGAASAWTGREFVIWGGVDAKESEVGGALSDGAAYDPESGRWRTLPAAPITARSFAASVWTGQEFLVWGGEDDAGVRADGAAYDPAADRWRLLAPAPLTGRDSLAAVWTGTEVLLFGGAFPEGEGGAFRSDGAAYNPATDRWRPLAPPQPPAPNITYRSSELWTGTELVVSSTLDRKHRFVAYNPKTDSWRAMAPILPPLENFAGHTVWTETEILVWGPLVSCFLADCTPELQGQAGLRITPRP